MKKYWFKAKSYGYGWYPATWEGWSVLFVYFLLVFGGMSVYVPLVQTGVDDETTLWFVFYLWLLTLVLVYVCHRHGEKLGWRWGKKKVSKRGKE